MWCFVTFPGGTSNVKYTLQQVNHSLQCPQLSASWLADTFSIVLLRFTSYATYARLATMLQSDYMQRSTYDVRKRTKGTFDVPPGNILHLCALDLLQCCNVHFTFDVPPGKSYVNKVNFLQKLRRKPVKRRAQRVNCLENFDCDFVCPRRVFTCDD